MWVALTVDDLLRSVTDAERTALRTAATKGGQDDPVTEAIAHVTAEIRGYVGACSRNSLDADTTTIPEELRNAAIARLRFEAFTRLPVGRSLLTQDRVDASDRAVALLRDVAACKFSVGQPTTVSTSATAGTGIELVRAGSAAHDFTNMGL